MSLGCFEKLICSVKFLNNVRKGYRTTPTNSSTVINERKNCVILPSANFAGQENSSQLGNVFPGKTN